MDNITRLLEDTITSLPTHNHNQSVTKQKLDKLLARQIKSVRIQMSSERILCFLVNDILDYAQINAGKFRKLYVQFNLKESIEEIMLIMKFKADQLGIKMECKLQGFEQPGMRSSLVEDDTANNYNIVLDQ